MISPKQREAILSRIEDRTGTYLLVPWEDYLDPAEPFTELNCQRGEGKKDYAAMIRGFLRLDENARIFAELYGLEGEDEGDAWVWADTLLAITTLPPEQAEEYFYNDPRVWPSQASALPDRYDLLVVDRDGAARPLTLREGETICSLWWD